MSNYYFEIRRVCGHIERLTPPWFEGGDWKRAGQRWAEAETKKQCLGCRMRTAQAKREEFIPYEGRRR